MSGIYTIQFTTATVGTAVQDFFEINPGTSKPLVLLGFGISQTSELGDAAEEGLTILVKSGHGTSGSGGAAVTPQPLDASQGTALFTAEANNTTKAQGGTIVTHYAYSWNVRMPLDIVYPEPMQVIATASRRLVIELASTSADSLVVNGYAVVQEIG